MQPPGGTIEQRAQATPAAADDVTTRIEHTAQVVEEIADYCHQYAGNLRKSAERFARDIQHLLGTLK